MTKKVIIGTPCYDGRIDVWYSNSLMNTIKLSSKYDVEIIPIWVSFDALIQRARNDTIDIAIQEDVDALIWIDSDIEWEPEWFFKLLNYDYDIVGGTYPKKSEIEQYVVRQMTIKPVDNNGIIEVDGLGTGFVKMSKKAITYLWNNCKKYIDPKDNKERRMIFEVAIEDESMISEDIYVFNKLTQGGFKIYLDTNMCCNHIGSKKYKGDYASWYKKLLIANTKKQL